MALKVLFVTSFNLLNAPLATRSRGRAARERRGAQGHQGAQHLPHGRNEEPQTGRLRLRRQDQAAHDNARGTPRVCRNTR
jgi:hypothetical protein